MTTTMPRERRKADRAPEPLAAAEELLDEYHRGDQRDDTRSIIPPTKSSSISAERSRDEEHVPTPIKSAPDARGREALTRNWTGDRE